MNSLFFQTDNNLCISAWGEEIAQFTGKPPEMALGNKYYEVLPFISLEGKDALAEAVRTNNPLTLRKYNIPCLFAQISADIEIVPLDSSYGNVKEVKVTLFPATTCTVAHKLNQSQQLINIGKIASTLAHGVRNPLNAIKGAVVYLSEKCCNDAPLVEFTRIMEEEISRLEDFITNFLISSVSDTDVKETDINSLLKKIEVFTSLQIYTKNIQSQYEYGNIPPILTNSFHLEQAILNVINNAIDAMPQGGLLKICTSTEERAGRIFVVVAISDTGQGIAEADRRLGELPTEKSENGKGFGLFITHEILNHYGGHVELDSKKNLGTTIKLFIPCHTQHEGYHYDGYRGQHNIGR
jgi:two-component system, NtrC family, nitrogen regulation sensor histidine kinase GlnL